MVNYFLGQSQADLETALRAAQDDLKAGKTIVEGSSGDSSAKEFIQADVYTRIEQILFALFLLDPIHYPAGMVKRVTRTRIHIYPWNDGLAQTL